MEKLAFTAALAILLSATAMALSPTVTVVSPQGPSYVKGTFDIVFQVTDTDTTANNMLFTLNYSLTQNGGVATGLNLAQDGRCDSNNLATVATCKYSWNTIGLTDGNYIVTVEVTDDLAATAGDSSDSSFVLDNTKPTAGHDANASWQKTNADLKLSCADNMGACSLTFRKDTDAGTGVSFGNSENYSSGIPVASDGNIAIEIIALDLAGNAGDSINAYVLVDKTGPSISTNTANNTWFNSDIDVQVTVSDAGSGITEVWIKKNGVPEKFTSFSGLHALFNADGSHSLDINALDFLGNSSTFSQTVLIDKNPPTVPAFNTLSTGDRTVNISWHNASDNGPSGLKNYEIYMDNTLVSTTSTPSFSSNGLNNVQQYEFKIRSVDNANNRSGFSEAIFATPRTAAPPADTSNPSVVIQEPEDEERVSGTIIVRATATDSGTGIDRVEFFVNNAQVEPVRESGSTFTLDLNTLRYRNGRNVLEARAFDGENNLGVHTIEIFVDNPVPVATAQDNQVEETADEVPADETVLGEGQAQPKTTVAQNGSAAQPSFQAAGFAGLFSNIPVLGIIVVAAIAALLFIARERGGGMGNYDDMLRDVDERINSKKGRWQYKGR